MGYLRYSDAITDKYYNADGVIVLGRSAHQVEYDEMLTSLQALAVLPFQLSMDFLIEKYARSKSGSPSHSPAKTPPVGSPTDDKQPAPMKPPRRTSTGITSLAWDWLKGGATEVPAEPIPAECQSNGMISSLTGMLGKWTGWDTSKGDGQQAPPSNCQSQQPANQEQPVQNVAKVESCAPERTSMLPVATGRCPVAVEEEFLDCEISDTNGDDTPVSPIEVKTKMEEPDNVVSVSKEVPLKANQEKKSAPKKKTTSERKNTAEKVDPDKEVASPVNADKTMIESVTGITQKLLGMGAQKEKPAYKKGVTDYDFNKASCEKSTEKGKVKSKVDDKVLKSPTQEKGKDISKTESEDTTNDKGQSTSKASTPEKPEGEKLQTSAERKSMIPMATSRPRNLGAAKGKVETKPPAGKNKSGLIKLFDKLLLPKDTTPKPPTSSQIPKIKNRWSWGASAQNTAPAESKTGAGARPKSVCVMKTEPLSKQPSTSQVKKKTAPASTAITTTTATKENPKNLNASPVTKVRKDQSGGLGNDQAKLNATQSNGDAVKYAEKFVCSDANSGPDQILTIQLDNTTGEASLHQTFHVDENGEAQLRQRVQLDHTGEARDQNLTVQWDKCSPVKLQQTVCLDQGQAKLHQTVEVDQEKESEKAATETKSKGGNEDKVVEKEKAGNGGEELEAEKEKTAKEGKEGNDEEKSKAGKGGDVKAVAAGRAAWKSVERGPTLFLPTNCKFLDNIEKRNNDPESPKRKSSASPNRRSTPSSTNSSPANSPKTSRTTKTRRRWSLHGNVTKRESVDLDVINSNSSIPKPGSTAVSKGKTTGKTDQSKQSKSDQSKQSKADQSKSNAAKNSANGKAANAEVKKLTNQKNNKEERMNTEKSSGEKEEGEFRFMKPVYR